MKRDFNVKKLKKKPTHSYYYIQHTDKRDFWLTPTNSSFCFIHLQFFIRFCVFREILFQKLSYSMVCWSLITVPLILCLQGGLRNSKHECTLSSQEYVHELRSGITEEKLLNCLESLRVSLTSNPVRLVNEAFVTFCQLSCSRAKIWMIRNPTKNISKRVFIIGNTFLLWRIAVLMILAITVPTHYALSPQFSL